MKALIWLVVVLMTAMTGTAMIVTEFVEAKPAIQVHQSGLDDFNTQFYWNTTHFVLEWEENATSTRELNWRIYVLTNISGNEVKRYIPEDTSQCATFGWNKQALARGNLKYAFEIKDWKPSPTCQNAKNNLEYVSLEFGWKNLQPSIEHTDMKVNLQELSLDYSDINRSGFGMTREGNEIHIHNVKALQEILIDPLITPSGSGAATAYSFQNNIFYGVNSGQWLTCWFNSSSNPEIGCANSSNGQDWTVFPFDPSPTSSSHAVSAESFSLDGANINGVDVVYIVSTGFFGTSGCWLDRFIFHNNGTLQRTNGTYADCGSAAAGDYRGMYVYPTGEVWVTHQNGNTFYWSNKSEMDTGTEAQNMAFNTQKNTNLFNGIGGSGFQPKVMKIGNFTSGFNVWWNTNTNPAYGNTNYSFASGTFKTNQAYTSIRGTSFDSINFIQEDYINTLVHTGFTTSVITARLHKIESVSGGTSSITLHTNSTIYRSGGITLQTNDSTNELWVFYIANTSLTNFQINVMNFSGGAWDASSWSAPRLVYESNVPKTALTSADYTSPTGILLTWTEGDFAGSTFNVTTYLFNISQPAAGGGGGGAGPPDCAISSTNTTVRCEDNIHCNTPLTMGGSPLILNGAGTFNIHTTISDVDYVILSDACQIYGTGAITPK